MNTGTIVQVAGPVVDVATAIPPSVATQVTSKRVSTI